MASKTLFFSLFVVLSFSTISARLLEQPLALNHVEGVEQECVYTLYIRTGQFPNAGTNSTISLRLYDVNGFYVSISNIVEWGGLMKEGHDYFERNKVDIFSARAACLSGPICAINITSDGSEEHHGWYSNYVEVTSTGDHTPCFKQHFIIEQWLSTKILPFELTAIRNFCPYVIPFPAAVEPVSSFQGSAM